MLNTTIKLTDETKGLLDEIQTKFGLKTYDNTVNKCAIFILRNEINLKEDYIGDYKKSLIDLENRLSAKFQDHEDKILKNYTSIRKWIGGVEKDYFKPLILKLDTLDRIQNLEFDKISVEKMNSEKGENPLNSHIKSEGKEEPITEETNNNISERDEKFKELYGKFNAQKQALFKIFNNAKVESGGMMSKGKIVINLTSEEWEELKNMS